MRHIGEGFFLYFHSKIQTPRHITTARFLHFAAKVQSQYSRSPNTEGSVSSYLNNAAEGWPKAPALPAVTDALTTPVGDIDRDAGSASGLIRACRMQAAELLGITDCNRIVFTANATYALNLSILGMKLGNGSLVAVSAAAHNSVLRPLERLRRETGIRVRVVACDATGAVLEEDYSSILRLEPRLVILNHRCNVTGHVEDVPRLFAQAHFAGPLHCWMPPNLWAIWIARPVSFTLT